MKKIMAILALTTLTVGCESTPRQPMQIEYQPFDANSSYAMNLATQTVLTKPFKRGGNTIQSPLKDFTKEEVSTLKTELTRSSGGNTSILFGALSILTGDFTGIINVVGGTAANMANSEHISTSPSFIIELKASEFESIIDAEKYIIDTVNMAAQKTLSRYGEVEKELDYRHQHTNVRTSKGNSVFFGMTEYVGDEKGERLHLRNVSLMGEKGEFLTHGIVSNAVYPSDYLIIPPIPLIYSIGEESLEYSEFYKEFTSHLPEGFYVYTPSFPWWVYDSTKYQNYTEIVPAIYTQGKKHEFLKG